MQDIIAQTEVHIRSLRQCWPDSRVIPPLSSEHNGINITYMYVMCSLYVLFMHPGTINDSWCYKSKPSNSTKGGIVYKLDSRCMMANVLASNGSL